MTNRAQRATSLFFLFLLSLAVPACSTATPKIADGQWIATRDDAQDLKAVQHTCIGLALQQITEITNEGLAIKAGLGFFSRCMHDAGWDLSPIASDKGATP